MRNQFSSDRLRIQKMDIVVKYRVSWTCIRPFTLTPAHTLRPTCTSPSANWPIKNAVQGSSEELCWSHASSKHETVCWLKLLLSNVRINSTASETTYKLLLFFGSELSLSNSMFSTQHLSWRQRLLLLHLSELSGSADMIEIGPMAEKKMSSILEADPSKTVLVLWPFPACFIHLYGYFKIILFTALLILAYWLLCNGVVNKPTDESDHFMIFVFERILDVCASPQIKINPTGKPYLRPIIPYQLSSHLIGTYRSRYVFVHHGCLWAASRRFHQ